QHSDPPHLKTKEIYERFLKVVETWSEDPSYMAEWMMPSQSGNNSFIRWIGRLQRTTCGPKDLRRQVDSVHTLDAGDAPERITAKTMVMHVKGDRVLPVAGSRLLTQIIPNAVYHEMQGEDHFWWIMPNWRDAADKIIEFMTGTAVQSTSRRMFAA